MTPGQAVMTPERRIVLIDELRKLRVSMPVSEAAPRVIPRRAAARENFLYKMAIKFFMGRYG